MQSWTALHHDLRGLSALLMALACCSAELRAGDWPTFGHDARRSQTTDEVLDCPKLQRAWTWKSVQPPLPAWGQPAKGDAFANLKNFASMRNYDPAFHPIVIGDDVYFASNADDAVYCLNAKSGKVNWTFIAGGPIRIAPTFADGRLHFGADDGFAYSVRADTGELVWKFSPTADLPRQFVLNNGRLISFWPCRTGVLVVDGVAYFGCSLLPWRTSYLCAADAATGKILNKRHYVQQLPTMTLEGPLVAGAELLYAPQGREAPLQFQRSDGKHLGALKDGFGAFCVLTPDNRLLHGPRRKGGGIVDSDATTRSPVATHKEARAMIVSEAISLMQTNTDLAAADLKSRKMLWKIPADDTSAIVLTGEHVILGGRDRVRAVAKNSGEQVWSAGVDGKVFGLAAANGNLVVSTDTGEVVCFRASQTIVTPAGDSPEDAAAASGKAPSPRPIEEFTDKNLLGRWVFSPLAVDDQARNRIQNLADGLPVSVTGDVTFEQFHGLDGVTLDGKTNTLLVTKDLATAKLPAKEMTAEAWARIDAVQKWGGIVGAIQDNGSYERGWLLGFQDKRFSFALAGQQGPGRLTYLSADREFTLQQWHHVAATYDGTTMRLYVDGELAATSAEQRGGIHYPPATFYELAAYHDDNEHYRATGLVHEIRTYDRVLSAEEIARHHRAKAITAPVFATLAAAPRIQFDTADSAVVSWETELACPSRLLLTDDRGVTVTLVNETSTEQHTLRVPGLKRDRRYTFVIEVARDGDSSATRTFELDTYFNYHLAAVPPQALRKDAIDSQVVEQANAVLQSYDRQRGLCLLMGAGLGDLAMEIARRGELRVIGMEMDAGQVAKSREKAAELGLHGARCSFIHVEQPELLRLPANIANLIVSQATGTDKLPMPVESLAQALQPGNGQLVLLDVEKELRSRLRPQFAEADLVEPHDQPQSPTLLVARRRKQKGAGAWTHMYGDATNAAYNGETLSGVTEVGQLEASWLGKPGPRYQTDRQNRKSSPLFAGGRLYMQGQERIIALDGYNGAVLWSLELPEMLRFNIPHDASNWCCDEDFLFVAIGNRCLKISGETGGVVSELRLPNAKSGREWGYVARTGELLLGSTVRPSSMFTEFWGVDFWFDQKDGVYTHQVCSESLFARETTHAKTAWQYTGGLIWNATITADSQNAYFIESRDVGLPDGASSRVPLDKLTANAWLVAIDLKTGQRRWQQQLEISPKTAIANMAYSSETLVLVTSFGNKFPVRRVFRCRWKTDVGHDRALAAQSSRRAPFATGDCGQQAVCPPCRAGSEIGQADLQQHARRRLRHIRMQFPRVVLPRRLGAAAIHLAP